MVLNKKATGYYFRNIINQIQANIEMLESELSQFKHPRFRIGIQLNLRSRKRQKKHYEKKLKRYIEEGRAE